MGEITGVINHPITNNPTFANQLHTANLTQHVKESLSLKLLFNLNMTIQQFC
ncbi:MAG: hypothetical protein V4592_00260 [Bacteroidota bacterium]